MKHAQVVFGVSLLAALACLLIAQPASAALITSTANLPPDGVYLTAEDVHARYAGPALEVLLEQPLHRPIADRVQRADGGDDDGDGNHDEIEQFDSTLEGTANVVNPPAGQVGVTASGPVVTKVFDRLGPTGPILTGTFDTEMLQMNLTGATPLGPFMIRESPTLRSTGQTTITDIGGGQFRIDSFFDVFTELSIDGGATWMPDTNGPARVELVPEPGTLTLLGLGAAVLAGLGWRRRRASCSG
jgi:hypothetical protein